ACLLVSVMAATLFGCGKAGGTIPEETAARETTAAPLSDEELDELSANMPEIVFVMSHHYDDTNILGCYITNTGEMKMYDFRNIAPDEMYELPDVYDRLEEAVCSEIDFKLYSKYENVFTEKDLVIVPENTLVEYYKELLQINGTVIKRDFGVVYDDPEYPTGHYRFYGIKYDEHGNRQCILLYGYGESYEYCYEDSNTDRFANELNYKIYSDAYITFRNALEGAWS
ncbi:MAG: hypothetical protein K2G87_09310, partial [Oscillospiraceae bacterium]|nr:hypothetical protein [Oscillospiraceae bacterium]